MPSMTIEVTRPSAGKFDVEILFDYSCYISGPRTRSSHEVSSEGSSEGSSKGSSDDEDSFDYLDRFDYEDHSDEESRSSDDESRTVSDNRESSGYDDYSLRKLNVNSGGLVLEKRESIDCSSKQPSEMHQDPATADVKVRPLGAHRAVVSISLEDKECTIPPNSLPVQEYHPLTTCPPCYPLPAGSKDVSDYEDCFEYKESFNESEEDHESSDEDK